MNPRLFLLALFALPACAAGECEQVVPLVAEVRAALDSPRPSAAAESVARLAEIAGRSKRPALRTLAAESRVLAALLRSPSVAPATADARAARDAVADVLGNSIRAWRRQADSAEAACR